MTSMMPPKPRSTPAVDPEVARLMAEMPSVPRSVVKRGAATTARPATSVSDQIEDAAHRVASLSDLGLAVGQATHLIPESRRDAFQRAMGAVTADGARSVPMGVFHELRDAARSGAKPSYIGMSQKYGAHVDPYCLAVAVGILSGADEAQADKAGTASPAAGVAQPGTKAAIPAVAADKQRLGAAYDAVKSTLQFVSPLKGRQLRDGIKSLLRPVTVMAANASLLPPSQLLEVATAVDRLVRKTVPPGGSLNHASHTRVALQYFSRYFAAVAQAKDPASAAADVLVRPAVVKKVNNRGNPAALEDHIARMRGSYLLLDQFPIGAIAEGYFMLETNGWRRLANTYAPLATKSAQAELREAQAGKGGGYDDSMLEALGRSIASNDDRSSQILFLAMWLGYKPEAARAAVSADIARRLA